MPGIKSADNMCYIEDGAQAHLHRMDNIQETDEKLIECTTCGSENSKTDMVNIGYDEYYCLKCCEDGSAERFIVDNEDPEQLHIELEKLKTAIKDKAPLRRGAESRHN